MTLYYTSYFCVHTYVFWLLVTLNVTRVRRIVAHSGTFKAKTECVYVERAILTQCIVIKTMCTYCEATVSPGITQPTVQCSTSAFIVPSGTLPMTRIVFQTLFRAQNLIILLAMTTIGRVTNAESVLMVMHPQYFLMVLPALTVTSTSISGY